MKETIIAIEFMPCEQVALLYIQPFPDLKNEYLEMHPIRESKLE